jgi:hypothetical protein
VNRTNAKVEGDATTRNASTPTTREGNVTQILEDNATVSGSQEAGNPAGKKKEMSHQMSLVSKALKRDLEAIISGEQALVEGSDGTARRTRALEHFIQTNVSYGATGANGASKTAPLTDGTPRAFTESLQNAVLQLCYENGGEPSLIVLGPGPKRTFSTFVGRAATQVAVGQKTVTNTVEVYQSDFGTLKAVPSPVQPCTDGAVSRPSVCGAPLVSALAHRDPGQDRRRGHQRHPRRGRTRGRQ